MKIKKTIFELFIEVYKIYDNSITFQSFCTPIDFLEDMLEYTEHDKDLKTIAIFKIKLK
jgi:hypothetical protein